MLWIIKTGGVGVKFVLSRRPRLPVGPGPSGCRTGIPIWLWRRRSCGSWGAQMRDTIQRRSTVNSWGPTVALARKPNERDFQQETRFLRPVRLPGTGAGHVSIAVTNTKPWSDTVSLQGVS